MQKVRTKEKEDLLETAKGCRGKKKKERETENHTLFER